MTAATESWFGKLGRLGSSDLGTQTAVLLPVIAIAGLTAWLMLSAPIRARSPSAETSPAPVVAAMAQPDAGAAPSANGPAIPAGPPAVNGLKISSQSWRRGGLGSNALVTFTLRNDNNYPVKDIEIACAFSREDGSHLTDRRRVIPDAVVGKKSRKTFAQFHVGYVNVNANKAKCALVAANGI